MQYSLRDKLRAVYVLCSCLGMIASIVLLALTVGASHTSGYKLDFYIASSNSWYIGRMLFCV